MKQTVLSASIILAVTILFFGVANAAEDLVVAVDKATLVKVIGIGILAFQAEIWRNQRVLFRSNEKVSKELKELKGYCKGRSGDCSGAEGDTD